MFKFTDINRIEFFLLLPLAMLNIFFGIFPNYILDNSCFSIKSVLEATSPGCIVILDPLETGGGDPGINKETSINVGSDTNIKKVGESADIISLIKEKYIKALGFLEQKTRPTRSYWFELTYGGAPSEEMVSKFQAWARAACLTIEAEKEYIQFLFYGIDPDPEEGNNDYNWGEYDPSRSGRSSEEFKREDSDLSESGPSGSDSDSSDWDSLIEELFREAARESNYSDRVRLEHDMCSRYGPISKEMT